MTKTIKIQASGTICKLIQKVLPSYEVKVVKLTEEQYRYHLGYTDYEYVKYEDSVDYDYKNDLYRAIRILYPEDYYATPRYISSRELRRDLKYVTTYEELLQELKNCYSI